MKYTTFEKDNISRLGFGAMRLPMHEDGTIDFETGTAMVDYAMANGITYYDTAYRYHEGAAEGFLKQTLVEKYPRDSYYLADKLPTWLCSSQEDAARIFEEQLANCGVEYFDYYLLHSIDEYSWPDIVKYQMTDYLLEQKAQGRIRHLGASVHCKAPLLRTILETLGDAMEFIQIQMNYMDWDYIDAKALYDLCVEFGKPVIVMEPIRGGMLANPMSDEARRILDEAGEGKLSYADYALGWCDLKEQVLCTLSGMSDLDQLKANIDFFNGESLTQPQLDAVEAAVKQLRTDILIPCTGCNYCFECPQNIKIAKIFSRYNEAASKGFHYIWGSLSKSYKKLGPNATDCIECGACESHCPQKIQIISELKRVHEKYVELESIGE